MKRFARFLVIACCCWPWGAAHSTPQAPGPATPEVQMTDRAFVGVLAKPDKAAVGMALDTQFSWARADGRLLSRAQALAEMPKPALGRETEVEVTRTNYGDVEAIRVHSGRTYLLRIWVKRPEGWRLIAYHEVVQAAPGTAQPATPATPPSECDNPCKSVPFQPETEMDGTIIKTWQAHIVSEWNRNVDDWTYAIADEFYSVNSGGSGSTNKATGLAGMRRAKEAGSGPAIPNELIAAQMFDFGPTAVMIAVNKTGNTYAQATRVWVQRGDNHWQMALSYQTRMPGPRSSLLPKPK